MSHYLLFSSYYDTKLQLSDKNIRIISKHTRWNFNFSYEVFQKFKHFLKVQVFFFFGCFSLYRAIQKGNPKGRGKIVRVWACTASCKLSTLQKPILSTNVRGYSKTRWNWTCKNQMGVTYFSICWVLSTLICLLEYPHFKKLAGVSILQENLNYSRALYVICEILPQIFPQLQKLQVHFNQGRRSVFDMGGWFYVVLRGVFEGDVPPSEAGKFCIFWNYNHTIWWILLGAKLEQVMGSKKLKNKQTNKKKTKNSSMSLTDRPNLVFWGKFWLNLARIENQPFFGLNLLIWAEIVLS